VTPQAASRVTARALSAALVLRMRAAGGRARRLQTTLRAQQLPVLRRRRHLQRARWRP
jgi:hypothetical protein